MHRSETTSSVVRSFCSAGFLLPLAILAAAALGLRPGLEALARHYQKEPIAIRKSLKEFDISRLPSFRTGWVRSDIPPDEIETDEYLIVRLSRAVPAGERAAVVLFVTYYSDPRSKVPHTPDVCYRQGGATIEQMKNIIIDVPELAQSPRVKARLLLLREKTERKVVVFCFCADGRFKHSREQVRWIIGKPGNRHVYFSKIETVAGYPMDGSPEAAIELCTRLFREAVPILVTEHFPTPEQLKR